MSLEQLRVKLEELASRQTWDEDEEFNPRDFSGENYDDAYSAGQTDGATLLARELLEDLKIILETEQ